MWLQMAVSLCMWPCNELASCPGCHAAFTLWQLWQAHQPWVQLEVGLENGWTVHFLIQFWPNCLELLKLPSFYLVFLSNWTSLWKIPICPTKLIWLKQKDSVWIPVVCIWNWSSALKLLPGASWARLQGAGDRSNKPQYVIITGTVHPLHCRLSTL